MSTEQTKEIATLKHIMNLLFDCVQDKENSIEIRNQYYQDYLELAECLLILTR